MKKIYPKIIIVLALVGFGLNLFSQKERQITTEKFSGSLKKIGSNWFIKTDDDFFQLELASEDYLLDFKIFLENEKEIEIKGVLAEDVITVHTFIQQKKHIPLRDKQGNPLWEENLELPTYNIETQKCVGCRLCPSICPTDAISMQNGVAVIDQEKCISCGICQNGDGEKYQGCPVNAISSQ